MRQPADEERPASEPHSTPASGIAAPIAVVALLGLWLLVKVRLFIGLEYSWDLFVALQVSQSWLMGRPLLWENRWGPDSVIHNYFVTPLLGPLTLHWGAYGLFVANAALLFLAYVELGRAMRPSSPPRRLAHAVAYLFGPVGFWIWDDPFYGWHGELLFLPLSVLFACALERRSRQRALWGALLVLLREDGPVVACSIQLLHVWLRASGPIWSGPGLLRSARVAAVWLTVLGVGLSIQRWAHPLATHRLSDALSSFGRVVTDQEALLALMTSTAGALLLFGSGLLIVAGRCRWPALVASLPVLGVAILGTLAYDLRGMVGHGPTWACRFVMLWGILGVAVAASPGRDGLQSSATTFWSSMVASVVAQAALLTLFAGYYPTRRLAQALPGADNILAAQLSERERSFLACLRDSLPTDTAVAAHARLFAYFHRHDLVWASYPQNAWRQPQVVVCESRGSLPKDRGCPRLQAAVLRAGFQLKETAGITVAYDPLLAPNLEGCSR